MEIETRKRMKRPRASGIGKVSWSVGRLVGYPSTLHYRSVVKCQFFWSYRFQYLIMGASEHRSRVSVPPRIAGLHLQFDSSNRPVITPMASGGGHKRTGLEKNHKTSSGLPGWPPTALGSTAVQCPSIQDPTEVRTGRMALTTRRNSEIKFS